MPKIRKPCPKHTTGTGPCYCQYHKDNNDTYHAPDDVKQVVLNISKIVGRRSFTEIYSDDICFLKKERIRKVNYEFIYSRIRLLHGNNLTRAYKTMQNLLA